MDVVVHRVFKADRKEPLGDMVRRLLALFENAGLTPAISASFNDAPGGVGKVSAVERALTKWPHLSPFERRGEDARLAALTARRLENAGAEQLFPTADVLSLADGVPRSLPFYGVTIHLGHPGFGGAVALPGLAPPSGLTIGDSWWVSGRQRMLSASYAVNVEGTAKKLPEPPAAVSRILSALGKPKQSGQFVLPSAPPSASEPNQTAQPPAGSPHRAVIDAIVAKHRAALPETLGRIGLPHSLPSATDVLRTGERASGPLKPTLVAAFGPRGYDCRGSSGEFRLRRRTANNYHVELLLDVGTWSRHVLPLFCMHGPGFAAKVMLPVSVGAARGQYPIGDTAHWEQIVANLGVIVDSLGETLVREIEAAIGPAPEWFEPSR